MTISLKQFSFNEVLHFKISSSADSSKTSTCAVISIDDTEEQDKMVEETPPKQNELNKQINVESEILVALYKKKELNQMTENDRKEIETWKENLEKLKKKLRELRLN